MDYYFYKKNTPKLKKFSYNGCNDKTDGTMEYHWMWEYVPDIKIEGIDLPSFPFYEYHKYYVKNEYTITVKEKDNPHVIDILKNKKYDKCGKTIFLKCLNIKKIKEKLRKEYDRCNYESGIITGKDPDQLNEIYYEY